MMPDQAADLRLDHLTKRFGSFTAVDELRLTVPAGSFFALLGPSGCGKTTTLRMVAGLEEPTSGRIVLGDRDLTERKPYRRPVNTVFQHYALFPHLSVFENVAFGLRRTGVRDPAAQVSAMLDLVELAGYEQRRPSQLSGGQQQRVALARALINHPQVLLLDEPLGALDLKLRRAMQLELKRIQTEVGITFIHVTHDQEEAMTMADTIAVMVDGRVEQLGGPVELYERPATAFVANFLGQSNLLDGRVVDRAGPLAIVAVGDRRVAVPADRLPPDATSLHVGVRPEKLTIVDADAVSGETNQLRGTIVDSSFTGVSTQYLVTAPGGHHMTVFAQNSGAAVLHPAGAQVRLCWRPEHTFAVPADPAAAAGGADAALEDAGPRDGRPAVTAPGESTPGTVASRLHDAGADRA